MRSSSSTIYDMRVRYTPRSRRDLQAIFEFIDACSRGGARAVKGAIVNAIRRLGSQPRLAPPTDEPDVHQLNVPRRSYKIYYRIEREEVWIIHVRDKHGSSGRVSDDWVRPATDSPGEGGRTKLLGAAIPLKAAGTALYRRPEARSLSVPPIPHRTSAAFDHAFVRKNSLFIMI
jgi:plasmid stabilization system protein ParE